MKLWTYIERNHERLGVALFVMPAILLPVLLIGLVVLISKP
jgi:hypothetical protein